MLPMAADVIHNMTNSGILHFPVWRIRTMMKQMDAESGTQVYWALYLAFGTFEIIKVNMSE